MRRLVGGAGVAAAADGQLDPAEVLDVGAVVELVGVAGGRVADQEPDRAALLGAEPAVAELVDDDRLAPGRPRAGSRRGSRPGRRAGSGSSPRDAAGPAPGWRRAPRRPPAAWAGTARRRGPATPRGAAPGRRTSDPGVAPPGPALSEARARPSVVPRRVVVPTGSESSRRLGGLADVVFQLPAAVVAGAVAPEFERADLGDVASGAGPGRSRPWLPSSAARAVSSGASSWSSSGAQRSRTVPAGSSRRVVEPRKRNSAGSPTTRPNSGPGTSASVPSSIPIGTTQSALIGGGTPGTAGADGLDARRSTTAARRRGSGPPCRAGPGRNRPRRGPRRGRGRPPPARGTGLAGPGARGPRRPAARSSAALKTPPLNSTAEGCTMRSARCGASRPAGRGTGPGGG